MLNLKLSISQLGGSLKASLQSDIYVLHYQIVSDYYLSEAHR